MAKQKGIFPVVGTLEGANFYMRKGKAFLRRAGGGFNGKAIKTKDSMKRVRENGSEFGHCSRVNKVFRMSLRAFHQGHRLSIHSRLMSLFTALKVLDHVSVRGERRVAEGVATPEGKALLRGYDYTPDCKVLNRLPFNYSIDPVTYALTFAGFDTKKVGFVTGATHIELTYGVVDFDFESLQYRMDLATPLLLDRSYSGDAVVLSPTLGTPAVGTRLCVLGVRYYQEVNGEFYLLKAADSVGIGVLGVN